MVNVRWCKTPLKSLFSMTAQCCCGNLHMDGRIVNRSNEASCMKCRSMSVKVVDLSEATVRAKGANLFILGCRKCCDEFLLKVHRESVTVTPYQGESGRRCSQPIFAQSLSTCFPVSLRKFITESHPVELTDNWDDLSHVTEDIGTAWLPEDEAFQPPSLSLAQHVLLCEFDGF